MPCADGQSQRAAAQLPRLASSLNGPTLATPKPAPRRRLADSGLGQLRGTGVDGGRGVLLEVADAEAVPVRWPSFAKAARAWCGGLAVEAEVAGRAARTRLCLGCAALASCCVTQVSVLRASTDRAASCRRRSHAPQGALDVLRQAFPTWTVQEYTAFAAYRKQQRAAAAAAAAEERSAAAARRSNKRPRVEAEAVGGARASGGSDSEGWMSRCSLM